MRIVVLPGDGIGPEITAATIAVLEVVDKRLALGLRFETREVGFASLKSAGTTFPDTVFEACRAADGILLGPVSHLEYPPREQGGLNPSGELRKRLDLYANLRPVETLPGVKSRYDNVDLIVVRENTEDLYSGLEHVVVPGVVESIKIITEKASTRIARFAFEYARSHGRKRISSVHKANIMKLSDGLFLDCCRAVAKGYPEITYDEIIVDNACMQLVLDPTRFDMLLLENLYGDIVSDLCAGFIGGLGMAPGANIGEDCAVFEAVHGSAPDIAGKNVANPMALILSGAMMLDHLGEHAAAGRLRAAVHAVLREGAKLTRDLGGTAGTIQIAEAIALKVAGA